MSAAAVMLVRDEADIIEHTIRHLLEHVDEVMVADNMSTDGTRDILEDLKRVGNVLVRTDREPGYWQADKTTRLAHEARVRGHRWVVPCDADEIWYAPDGRRIADYLAGLAPDISIVKADLYNHIPTADDTDDPDPTMRIGWRFRSTGALPKVAVRMRGNVEIHAGNHGANVESGLTVGGLTIRHFSWRSEEQYLRKILNGREAYSHTDLPDETGAHWRMFEGASDDAIRRHFREWFWVEQPIGDSDLIYDPAPVAGRVEA